MPTYNTTTYHVSDTVTARMVVPEVAEPVKLNQKSMNATLLAYGFSYTRAHQVFRACHPRTLIAPGKAPRVYMADGMVKTPVAKMTTGKSVGDTVS